MVYGNYSMISHNISNVSINQSNSQTSVVKEPKRSNSQSEKSKHSSKSDFDISAVYDLGTDSSLTRHSDVAWNPYKPEKMKGH